VLISIGYARDHLDLEIKPREPVPASTNRAKPPRVTILASGKARRGVELAMLVPNLRALGNVELRDDLAGEDRLSRN
jgi:hypothetical protein